MDNYADAWKGNNKEAILEFDYNKDSGPNHTFDQYYVPQCDGYDFGALGTPTQEMAPSFTRQQRANIRPLMNILKTTKIKTETK